MACRLRAFATLLVLSLSIGTAVAATPQQVASARNNALAWLITQQLTDGSWRGSAGLEFQATGSAVEALATAGMRSSATFGKGISWLGNHEPASVDSEARKIMALVTAPIETVEDVRRLLAKQNRYAAWGAYAGHATSFPDTPLALSAIRLSGASFPGDLDQRRVAIFCQIIPARRGSAGWAYQQPVTQLEPSLAQASAALPTALTILELNASKALIGPGPFACSGSTGTLQAAIDGALAWLLTKRNPDGGFGDTGTSEALLSAVVHRTLKSLPAPPQPATDGVLDYLIAQQRPDGSWQGDAFVTAAVLQAFPSVTLTDTDKDGIPDPVELVLGTNPGVPDSGAFTLGTGAGVPRFTVPAVLASGETNRFFHYAISPSGGTPPYTYVVATGVLPTGLTLGSGTGIISGTPTVVGSFSFDYDVADASGASTRVLGRIDISDGTASEGEVPTLPEWGMLAMGAVLLWRILWYRSRSLRS